MRKFLLIGLLFVSASACADSVTLYGIVDAAVQYVHGTQSAAQVVDGDMSASRFGLTGTESISPSTEIEFDLEAGFNLNNGTEFFGNNTMFGRQAWVGIKGPLGELRLGRQFTPAFYALAKLDPFGINASMSPFDLLGKSSAQGAAFVPYGSRFNNAVEYSTPNFHGLTSQIVIAPGGAAGNVRSGTGLGANVMYQSGPLYAFYAFQGAYNVATPVAPNVSMTLNHYVGLAYQVGPVEVGGLYAVSTSRGMGTLSSRDAGVTLNWTVNAANALKAAAIKRVVLGADERPFAVVVGWDHLISKRTTVYARGLVITNSHGASDTLDNIPIAQGSGDTGCSVAIGIRQVF